MDIEEAATFHMDATRVEFIMQDVEISVESFTEKIRSLKTPDQKTAERLNSIVNEKIETWERLVNAFRNLLQQMVFRESTKKIHVQFCPGLHPANFGALKVTTTNRHCWMLLLPTTHDGQLRVSVKHCDPIDLIDVEQLTQFGKDNNYKLSLYDHRGPDSRFKTLEFIEKYKDLPYGMFKACVFAELSIADTAPNTCPYETLHVQMGTNDENIYPHLIYDWIPAKNIDKYMPIIELVVSHFQTFGAIVLKLDSKNMVRDGSSYSSFTEHFSDCVKQYRDEQEIDTWAVIIAAAIGPRVMYFGNRSYSEAFDGPNTRRTCFTNTVRQPNSRTLFHAIDCLGVTEPTSIIAKNRQFDDTYINRTDGNKYLILIENPKRKRAKTSKNKCAVTIKAGHFISTNHSIQNALVNKLYDMLF